MNKLILGLVFCLFTFQHVWCQIFSLEGNVRDISTTLPLLANIIIEDLNIAITTDNNGNFRIENIAKENIRIKIQCLGYQNQQLKINLAKTTTVVINLESKTLQLNEVVITNEKQSEDFSIIRLKAIDGTAIYAGKKTEVILPDLITANKATNNARQIFAKVPGLNIWESDGAGLQMGIGGRGLSPNRNSNFNVRQNGYDISADALGYPESYYTPPIEAIERIEIVRGAASLQYGTQFGGLVNFVLKKGNENNPIEFTTRQTVGSWGLYNNFTSVGGDTKKVNYYGFYQYKRGNGWREHSEFQNHTAYAYAKVKLSKKVQLSFEYTHTQYITQQAGGLTDAQFDENPKQTLRYRNWFQVKWNLPAMNLDYKISDRTKINMRQFVLLASRDALGILTRINEADLGQNRDLLKDDYLNFGNETRLVHRYNLFKQPHVVLTGVRIYNGLTTRKQGFGDNGSEANFNYLNENNPGISDYRFPGFNASWFAENIFNIRKNLSITPGIRTEFINTKATGNYNITVKDFAGNIVSDTLISEQRSRKRSIALMGIGISYKPLYFIECYTNFSQNYRSITFSDLRVVNPNFRVDPNIEDERGFNADLGFRGTYKQILNYDLSTFLLSYNNRIGLILQSDTIAPFLPYRYRTNIGASITYGLEAFIELSVLNALGIKKDDFGLNIFTNISVINAFYTKSKNTAIEGNEVELVPPFLIRTGVNAILWKLKLSLQFSYVEKHFTDASNAIRTSTAVNGIIPSYFVMDFGAQYPFKKWFQLEAGINNLTNNQYFTRRADGYPGPGIIPSDAINFYVALQFKIAANKK